MTATIRGADGVSHHTRRWSSMSRAAAWSIRGIGRETREAAHEAARRAGMSLSEWLDEAIAERAAEQGVDPDEFDPDDRLDAIADRLNDLSSHDQARNRNKRLAEPDEEDEAPVRRFTSREDTKRAEDLLEAAIARFESRAAKAEERTARALDSVAEWIEKRQVSESERAKEAVSAMRQVETVARDLDKRISDLSNRLDASERSRRESRPRIDLAEAVSQIARRRQALDGDRSAGSPAPQTEAASGWRNFGVDLSAPAAAPIAAPARDAGGLREELERLNQRLDEMRRTQTEKASEPNAVREELQRLNQRLEEFRRAQSEKGGAPEAEFAALRGELSAMSRALAELAPRNAVVAIEGAVRDLSERVAALRDNSLRDSLAKPVDEIVAAIRETLQAHDPRKAVVSLEREIGAINDRLDVLARAKIEPEALERIRRQTEEVRNMLSAAALRPMPVDRLEKQIGELADRVDRLGSSRSPHVDSAQVVASLDNARAEIERSTSAAVLNVVERRLEEIAVRMDQALARAQSASSIGSKAVEELARRIDSVRETIETRHPLPIVSASLEATMRELAAKLQEAQQPRFDAEPIEAWMREMSAKLETARPVALDTKPLESWMRELTAKLDGARPISLDTGPLEQALRAIDDKISQASAPQFQPNLVDETAQALARQIEAKLKPAVDVGAIEALIRGLEDKLQQTGGAKVPPEALGVLRDQIGRIDARLDQTQSDLAALNSMGRLVGQFSAKLDEMRESLRKASAEMAARGDAVAARDIEGLRAAQEASERRVQTTLGGLQGLLEKLVDRMTSSEDDVSHAGAPAEPRPAPIPPPLSPDKPEPAQAKRNEPPPVTLADRPGPRLGGGQSRGSDSPDFLIEPGAGAPAVAQPKAAINAHIAAARSAAQAASGEAGAAADKKSAIASAPSATGR